MNREVGHNREMMTPTDGSLFVAMVTMPCGLHPTHRLWLVSEDDTAWVEAEHLMDVLGPFEVEAVMFRADHTFRPWGPAPGRSGRM